MLVTARAAVRAVVLFRVRFLPRTYQLNGLFAGEMLDINADNAQCIP